MLNNQLNGKSSKYVRLMISMQVNGTNLEVFPRGDRTSNMKIHNANVFGIFVRYYLSAVSSSLLRGKSEKE